MTANTPPKPHAEGDKFTNTETGITYEFKSGAWRAVSSEAADAVVDAISELDLEKVLIAGNVATQGAEFGGKVKVLPGTESNEAVTYQQLAELDQEIEDIRPSIDRGEWTYIPDSNNVTSGQYVIYKVKVDSTYCQTRYTECILAAGEDDSAKSECNRRYMDCGVAADAEDPDLNAPWEWCDFIKFHKTDVNGKLHTFSDAEGGMYVEVFNTDGSGYGLYQIIPNGVAGGGGQAAGFYVTHLASEGVQNGNARIKLFKLASGDPADYVRKAGDTMTGRLMIERARTDENANSFIIRGRISGAEGILIKDYQRKNNSELSDFIEYFGSVTSENCIVNKKYVDDAITAVAGPAFHKWAFKDGVDKKDLKPGEFTGAKEPTYGKGTNYSYYFHPQSLTGEMGFYKDYDMYFPMNALWGGFHYSNKGVWKLKQFIPVRNIHMFKDDNYLEIYSHKDYPSGGDIIAGFEDDVEYYFSIGGII